MAYKENCLQNVIIRIDFVEDFVINETDVKIAMVGSLPVIEQEEMQGKEIVDFIAEDGTSNVKITIKKWINHSFWDRQKTKRIVIFKNSIFIEVYKYDSYNSIKNDFIKAVEVIKADYNEALIKRIGMRYINKIDLTRYNRSVWPKYIKKSYIDAATLYFDESSFVSSNNTVDLSYEDYKLRFIFGFLNPDSPSVQKRHIFTLDFDAFTLGEMSVCEVSRYLDLFHERIETMFEDCLKDGQRNRMGVKASD